MSSITQGIKRKMRSGGNEKVSVEAVMAYTRE
jgi:hypothetical protein